MWWFILSGVLENFLKSSLKNYGFCPSHYLSAPALSWDVMFNVTKVDLKVISDAEIYLLLKKNTKGGVCYICYNVRPKKVFKVF